MQCHTAVDFAAAEAKRQARRQNVRQIERLPVTENGRQWMV
jgi:hypothetical protein